MSEPIQPVRKMPWALKAVFGILLLAVLVFVVTLSAAFWVLKTENGTRFLLNKGPEVLAVYLDQVLEIEHTQGTLWEGVTLKRLSWTDGKTKVSATQLELKVVLDGLLKNQLEVQRLHVDQLDVALAPPNPEDPPFKLPESIPLPVSIDLLSLQINQLKVGALEFDRVQGHASARAGVLDIQELKVNTEDADLGLLGQLKLAQPYAIDAALTAKRRFDNLDLDGSLRAMGSLQRLELALDALGTDLSRNKVSQEVHATAVVKPFDVAMVERVKMDAKDFNPRQWFDSAPIASLNIKASLEPNGDFSRSEGGFTVRNSNPLSIQKGGLPIQNVVALFDLRMKDQVPIEADMTIQVLEFASALDKQKVKSGGTATGQVSWTATKLEPEGDVSKDINKDANKDTFVQAGDVDVVLNAKNFDSAAWFDLPAAQLLNIDLKARKLGSRLVVSQLDVVDLAGAVTGALAPEPAGLSVVGELDWAGKRKAKADLQFKHLNPARYLPKAMVNSQPLLRGDLSGSALFDGELRSGPGVVLSNPLDGKPAAAKQTVRADWTPSGLLQVDIPASTLGRAPLKVKAEIQGNLDRLPRVVLNADLAGNQIALNGAYGGAEDFLDLVLTANNLKKLGELTGQKLAGTAEVKAKLRGAGLGKAGAGISGDGVVNVNQLQLGTAMQVEKISGKFQLGLRPDSPWNADLLVTGLKLPKAEPPAALDQTPPEKIAEVVADAVSKDLTPALVNPKGGLQIDKQKPKGLQPPKRTVAARNDVQLQSVIKTLNMNLRGTRSEHVLNAEFVSGLTPFSSRRPILGNLQLVGGLDAAELMWKGSINTVLLDGLWRPVRTLKLEKPAALRLKAGVVELGDFRLVGEDKSLIHNQVLSINGKNIRIKGAAPNLTVPQFSTLLKQQISFEPKDLVVTMNWDYKASADSVDGHLDVRRVSGGFRILEDAEIDVLVDKFDVNVDFDRQSARLDAQMDARNFGQLMANLKIPVEKDALTQTWGVAGSKPMEGAVAFSVSDLTWLGPLINPGVRTSGDGQLAVAIGGTMNDPKVEGRLFARGLLVNHLDQGLRLEDGDVVVDFNSDRAKIEKLEFTVYNRQVPRNRLEELGPLVQGVGKVTAEGLWNLDGLGGGISLKLDNVGLIQRADRWVMLDGNITAKQAVRASDPVLVRGDLTALGAYVEIPDNEPQRLGSDVVIRGQTNNAAGKPLPVDVLLTARLGEKFYLHAKGLRTRLAGGLNLAFQDGGGAVGARTGRRLLANGTINTVGGTYRAYGQDLTIERGVVNFQGPLDNPGLNIRAVRKGVAVEAGVEVTGSARRPLVTLVSEPAVPDSEKLSWMIIGRGSNSSDKEATLLLTAAAAIFGDDDESTTRKIARALGIDDLGLSSGSLTAADSRAVGSKVAIAPGADRSATISGADDPLLSQRIISLGKRLNDDLYLSFEQSVTTAASIVKLTYQYSRRLSFIARGGADNAVDVLYQFSFD